MRKHIQQQEKIIITLIEKCNDTNWCDREKYWIKYYKELNFDLMNVSEGGRGVITSEMRSIDSKQRSINAHKKVVYVYYKDGTFYKKFNSIVEASQDTKASKTNIGNVLHKRAILANGYHFSFIKINQIPKIHKNNIVVYEYDLNFNLIKIWNSLTALSRMKKLDRNNLIKKIKLKQHLYKNSYYYLEPIN